MARRYEQAVEECGEDCPAFIMDGHDTAVHACEYHDHEMPAVMFQKLHEAGGDFPPFCPLQEIDD